MRRLLASVTLDFADTACWGKAVDDGLVRKIDVKLRLACKPYAQFFESLIVPTQEPLSNVKEERKILKLFLLSCKDEVSLPLDIKITA